MSTGASRSCEPRRTASSYRPLPLIHEVFVVAHEKHAVAHRDPEEGEEAHERGHAEHAPSQPDRDHAADQGKRQVHEDDRTHERGLRKAMYNNPYMPARTIQRQIGEVPHAARGFFELPAEDDLVTLGKKHGADDGRRALRPPSP